MPEQNDSMCASTDFECPQPSGEAVAARDKPDRRQGDTPPSGERLRDGGQAGRSDEQSPIRSSDTNSVGSKCALVYEPPTDEQLANFICVMTFGPGATAEQRTTALGLVQTIPFLKTEWLHRHREMQEAAWNL